jgi:predicted alpha/beta-hydrolase family hydrolase
MRKLEILSREELKQMAENLARSGVEALRYSYNTAYARCRMINGHPPSARSIQELVQVWRQLWKRQS